MICSAIRGLGSSSTPDPPNDEERGNNPEIDIKKPESTWSDLGYNDIYILALNLLATLPQKRAEEQKATSSLIPVTEEERTYLVKGFVLEKAIADLLLEQRVYFIHFPSVYCYDKNHIICRIGEGHMYHQVTTIHPNPPGLQVVFDIEGVEYCFDYAGVLWSKLGSNWLIETTYPELHSALSRVVEYIEASNLHIDPGPSYGSPSGGPSQSTVSQSEMHSMSTNTSEEESLRPLGPNPDQLEIDEWINHMKQYRALRAKEGIRLAPIRCPVLTCGKIQRRPQALRAHLYFHFSIKPYWCDYGCPIAFETEANKNRHLETCAFAQGSN
ncbi:hypothetical protein RhiXN_05290 [Rhizoctonia solani]|uniref:C2H2-type domain-containing protein n=1 Tax=Rhizoctonia solani TaxID=456999 RepID=A0A8H8NS19_9AGAM|nr:uncharacterized protein RhiXN_05290 [Rhizoctonia solani]QRW17288.1 hypothetical protein RhiXN_05290 [Rhizoctonia solani]